MGWKPETDLGKKCDELARELIKGLPKSIEVLEREEVLRILNALLQFMEQKNVNIIDNDATKN